jgi:hypothetical protein
MRILVLIVLVGGCMVGAEPRQFSADQPLPADLAEGDIVVLGEIGVIVPPPGQTAGVIAEQDDGNSVRLVVQNPVGGAVRLVEAPEPVTGPVAVTDFATVNECNDGAYNLEGSHWTTNYSWYFDAGSTPSANSQANVEIGLQTGANAITNQRNKCGYVDKVSATNSYAGRTTAAPNLTANSTTVTCGNTDGKNVVGFGYLPTNYLAITCDWYGADNVSFEADIRLNSRRSWFSQAVPSGCSNKDGIEQVSTHEFGHVFGLAHVSQTTHPELTMSPQAAPCSNDKLNLGWGDIRGLRALYPL